MTERKHRLDNFCLFQEAYWNAELKTSNSAHKKNVDNETFNTRVQQTSCYPVNAWSAIGTDTFTIIHTTRADSIKTVLTTHLITKIALHDKYEGRHTHYY